MDQAWKHSIARHALVVILIDHEDDVINREEAIERIVEITRWEYREALDALKEE